jgi:hypothetical protein
MKTFMAMVGEKTVIWEERRLVIRSFRHANAARVASEARLEKVQTALEDLNRCSKGKPRFLEVEPLYQAAKTICKQYQVKDLLRKYLLKFVCGFSLIDLIMAEPKEV